MNQAKNEYAYLFYCSRQFPEPDIEGFLFCTVVQIFCHHVEPRRADRCSMHSRNLRRLHEVRQKPCMYSYQTFHRHEAWSSPLPKHFSFLSSACPSEFHDHHLP